MSNLIRISESDDWIVDYDKERGMYRVSYFQENHFVDEHWFDAFEEKELDDFFPHTVGNITYYTKEELFEWVEEQQKKNLQSKIKVAQYPNCSVGDVVWYTGSTYNKEPVKCKVSMLQQKVDKSWKVRLTPPSGSVFDLTLEEFNEYCFFDQEEAEGSMGRL